VGIATANPGGQEHRDRDDIGLANAADGHAAIYHELVSNPHSRTDRPEAHMPIFRTPQASAQPEVDLQLTYDAIVIGSGAAGGMAAHVMTSQGMKVLMLEAGKKLDIDKELKSLEWPYDHPRRGDMPPGHHALSLNEYTIRQPPYAADSKYPKVFSYV